MKKAIIFGFMFLCTMHIFAQNWTEPINVSNLNGMDNQPDIIVDQNGTIHCVWAHKIEENYWKIYYSKSVDGGTTWFTPEDISLNNEKWVSNPHIVADSENNLHITYDFNVGNPYQTLVIYKKFDGINWSEPFIVSENMPESHANKLVIDNNDRIYCFWFRILYNETTFYRYLENGVWSEVFIPYNNNDYFTFLNCAIDTNNNLHWIGVHHYEGQTVYDIKPVYFYYDYDYDEWSDFIEFGEGYSWHGFDIDLDNSEKPHLVWQEFINDSTPPNGGTFYVYNNGIDWTVPELIIEDAIEQQIEIDEFYKTNIFNVEKLDIGTILVHNFKIQDNWEGYIIDESEYNTMHSKIINFNYHLFAVYLKPFSDIGEIFFSKSDILTHINIDNFDPAGLQVSPNPFNNKLRIRFELKGTGLFTINTYNLQGKLINTIFDENKAPGKYEIMWNGTDKNGKEVKSGLYLIRLQAGRQVMTRSVEIIK